MTSTGERLFYAMVIGFLATAPFYVLEYYCSNGYPRGVPAALFRMMWVETTLFAFLAFSIYRTQFKSTMGKWIIPFLLKLAAMTVIAIAWITVVIDQMPCFLGGRGC
jgi:hypothetical protein